MADFPLTPTLRKIASSSASANALAPKVRSFSRGWSAFAQLEIGECTLGASLDTITS